MQLSKQRSSQYDMYLYGVLYGKSLALGAGVLYVCSWPRFLFVYYLLSSSFATAMQGVHAVDFSIMLRLSQLCSNQWSFRQRRSPSVCPKQ
ncbi:hypothetical protein P280DRAFT_264606 [Massarina eburnea CBS 473.64]|uniref:Uncharacterized protein n=1 Tax=Massarina eburnea CBS 473.64 TaxID=1395130 RepID=A0A6A6S3E7_9PLEO|nr:hypothetical protein P280DRAFT_264606 [Massarina eburnea CBS 473.64]